MSTFNTPTLTIQYQTWGDPRHRPILFFHGFPGSHIQASALLPQLHERKIFLIASDRPGYGGTLASGPNVIFSYLNALRELLIRFKVDKFDIIGVSGGAPWAHLMASRFFANVRALGIIGGLGTVNNESKEFFSSFQYRLFLLRRILPSSSLIVEAILGQMLKRLDPEKILNRFLRVLNAADREVLLDPATRRIMLLSMKEARAQGAKGIGIDSLLYHRDWLRNDCDPLCLSKVPTFYFHGKEDKILSYRISEWMHHANPNSILKLYEGEGHYSLPLRRADAILTDMDKF